MDWVEHCSANMISPSPLEADPHEAEHVEVRLSSIPQAGQGLSQKKSHTQRRPIALWRLFGENGCILGNWHNFEIIFGQNRPVQIGLSILHFSFLD